LLAIVVGIASGAAVGVVGVRTLEPGRPGQPDSLQVMLDSVRQRRALDPQSEDDSPRTAATRDDTLGLDTLDGEDAARIRDSITLARDPDAVTVPNVIAMDEGTARNALTQTGLVVGQIEFLASRQSAGTVLGSAPSAGARARAGSAVSLIVSDGRAPPDTGARH
jgi:serine/threonine-protein kinase